MSKDSLKSGIHLVVNRGAGNGVSPYRLVDHSGRSIEEVNKLDFLAVRGLSKGTTRIYGYRLLNFWTWLTQAKINLKDITRNSLLEYIRYQHQHSSPVPTTINHRVITVQCLYQYHFDQRVPGSHRSVSSPNKRSPYRMGWLHPFRAKQFSVRVKVPYRIIVPLTHQEVSGFFNSLKNWRDIAMTGFMLFCGLRSNEVISLKLDDVSTTEDQARIQGKGNKQRIVPLPKDLIMALNRYLSLERPKTNSEHLFVVLKGPHRGSALTYSAIDAVFRYHRKISGVPKANPHRFRHTFGSDMTRAGISLPVLMKLMGHTHVQTTMRYVNLFDQDIRVEFHKAVTKLQTRKLINESKTEF